MRTILKLRRREQGYALMMSMIFAGISIFILSMTLQMTFTGVTQTERNNVYNRTVAAAEAGTEVVMARMARDFLSQGINYSNLDPYRNTSPSTYIQNGWVSNFEFADAKGAINHATVTSPGTSFSTNVDAKLPGLVGTVFPCEIISNARALDTLYTSVAAGVRQDFQLASIPLFQFMAFYSMNLEINPGPLMKLTGKIHSNADIYTAPGSGLEYVDPVSAVGKIYLDRCIDDPQYGMSKVAPIFDVPQQEKVGSMSLPIGTNNSPAQVATVVDVPPAGESVTSVLGKQRYYNKVDLVVTTSASGVVTVKAGLWNGWTTLAGATNNAPFPFIKTTATFNDARENKDVVVTDLDIGALKTWLAGYGSGINGTAKTMLGHDINSIYVDDQRAVSGKLTAVRVSNGETLPSGGLTVATGLPLYVQGNFNAPDLTPGSGDTSMTRPASLIGDSVTILSTSWVDGNSTLSLASRTASDTTVNAAILAGIVPTVNLMGTKHYSGGLENFPRFLEEWTGTTFTYNGSMVVMFPSRYATGFWDSPGTYYGAPIRQWAFDQNFLVQSKLPPCTPMAQKIVRGQWAVVAATGF